ncbi:hypothetical protein ABIC30_005973 [Methylobacterium sp. 1030]
MQILARLERWIFPCTRRIEQAHKENSRAVYEAVCTIRSLHGRRTVNCLTESGKPAE